MDKEYPLERFLEAQAHNYHNALTEIRNGHKETHWMWYVFPQIAGLGMSAMSQKYAITDETEAALYLAHPILGMRLIEICEALMPHKHKTAYEIFGKPDDKNCNRA
ncbi:MAG TPA: DUF1810 family protein [Chitinophagales bacterium]|nr:DUF1810 family protein [Chitinophagales bacterium]HRK28810.1 DUF1810 family protein [Chitinophagales bacterium]